LPIEVSNIKNASALGAAMLAGVAISLYKNLDQAYDRVKKPGKFYKPDLELNAKYKSLFKIYKSIYPALKLTSNALFDRFKG
jgi:sugar (pentulose or hexulose) kinase